MAWQTTGDVTEFLAAAGPYLRRERARNTVILTVTETMRVSAAAHVGEPDESDASADPATRPLLGWWSDAGGAVDGAFLHTPQYPVVLTAVAPEAAAELAAATLVGRYLPGVNAYPEVAEAFADGWQSANDGRVEVHLNQRLYQLVDLSWPDPAPDGMARLAADADLPLVAEWFTAFAVEVNDMGGQDQTAAVRERASHGGITIWAAGGRPVAIACATRQVAGMARIGPVYTPPEFRGRGYGSAATAAASQRLLDAGVNDVVLFTDLANPVSNSIYQRIGYRAVEDRVVLEFTAQ